MRDLEIRGAGNLLGSEQSGFIEAMGFETYTRILDEAVRELKEQEFSELFPPVQGSSRLRRRTVVEPGVNAFIPESYIGSDSDRLGIYRRLFAVETSAQLDEVSEELADRFGAFPNEVVSLFDAVRLRMAAAELGFPRVAITDGRLEAEFPAEDDETFYDSDRFQQLMATISGMKDEGALLRQDGKTLRASFRLIGGEAGFTPLRGALALMDRLAKPSS
jgi:transcription-repair coupling factor (superfamily II helicase)